MHAHTNTNTHTFILDGSWNKVKPRNNRLEEARLNRGGKDRTEQDRIR